MIKWRVYLKKNGREFKYNGICVLFNMYAVVRLCTCNLKLLMKRVPLKHANPTRKKVRPGKNLNVCT